MTMLRLLLQLALCLAVLSTVSAQVVDSCAGIPSATFDTCVGRREKANNAFCGWCLKSTTELASCVSEVTYNANKALCAAGFLGYLVVGEDGKQYATSTIYDTKKRTGSWEVEESEIKVALRPGETLTVPVTVQPNQCKNLDFYYLLDITGSMRGDLDNLKKLASTFTSTVSKLCNPTNPNPSGCSNSACANVGFGTFADKPISPIGYWRALQDADKVNFGDVPGQAFFKDQTSTTAFNYVFRNSLSLTAAGDGSAFTNAVNAAKLAENIDFPESSLEAMLQAAACKNIVKWRADSRRMIFLVTDADPHMAGDGTKAGLYKRNTATCYVPDSTTDAAGIIAAMDAASITQDYPSVGQLADVLLSSNVFPIFAYPRSTVPASVDTFENINDNVFPSITNTLGFGSTITLKRPVSQDDTSNVVNAVVDAFNTVLKNVRLNVLPVDGYVTATLPAPVNLGFGTKSTLNFQLSYDGTNPVSRRAVYTASPVGYESAQITVSTLPYYSQCNTTNAPNFFVLNCNGRGTNVCGRCVCNAPYSGPKCECDESTTNCVSNGLTCSGHGKCNCNQCACEPDAFYVYDGAKCDCARIPCRDNCNGNGVCGCGGICTCNSGFTGAACECRTGASICQVGDSLCVHGTCVAGECSQNKCACSVGYTNDAKTGLCTVEVKTCPIGPNGLVCSGNGNCNTTTGLCECTAPFSSTASNPACSCNTDSSICPNGCSGHGSCVCGVCVCEAGYKADVDSPSYDCSCPRAACKDDCNGHGSCVCGKCVCSKGYRGDFCDDYCPATGKTCAQLNCDTTGKTIDRTGKVLYNYCDEECGICRCVTGEGDDCRCSTDDCPSINAKACSGHGSCNCAQCTCDAGWASPSTGCGCNTTKACPADNEDGAPDFCGANKGRGRCVYGELDDYLNVVCAKCECSADAAGNPLWSGDNCNCSTVACQTSDEPGNPQCGAKGECNCGKCKCKDGFLKDAAGNCLERCTVAAQSNCKNNGDTQACSGRGNCTCGECKCPWPWAGEFCEICTDESCYDCTAKTLCSDCAQQQFCAWCGTNNVGGSPTGVCIKRIAQSSMKCDFNYTSYGLCTTGSSGGISTTTKIGVGAGVGAGLACAGVAGILGFKLYQRAMDKKEWEKFEKERQRSEWKSDQNPLYQSSVRETENPLYVGR